jgi:hypothetical protein
MNFSRRGFIASLAAWLAARRLPKKPAAIVVTGPFVIGQYADYYPPPTLSKSEMISALLALREHGVKPAADGDFCGFYCPNGEREWK